jgi:hypothetical protein
MKPAAVVNACPWVTAWSSSCLLAAEYTQGPLSAALNLGGLVIASLMLGAMAVCKPA